MESDSLGKLIFISLVMLSIISWSILIYKVWLTRRVEQDSLKFKRHFLEAKTSLLQVSPPKKMSRESPNAFYIVYDVVKSKTMELLERNKNKVLSSTDMDLLSACAQSAISSISKYLEKHLYILSTIVTLAPFLGLLGTVYGILTTFSTMQQEAVTSTNQLILGGLSLALTTTVIGLVDAIPALIGYNYLKNVIYNFDIEMQRFATDVMTQVEMQYRKVDVE